jgi:branched-chain amino acid transport system substrate-binding protein
MLRRSSLRLGLACLGAVFMLGFGGNAPAHAKDLRIGFMAPFTGIFTQLGVDMKHGFDMYLNAHHNMLGGMHVKVFYEDTQGKPDVAIAKANKLILQNHVDMLVGGVLATTGYALAPVATRHKVLYIGSIATADDLGQRKQKEYPYMVRPTFVPSQPSHPLGQWACDQGYKKVVTIAADYAFGYETLGGFQQTYEDCGGKVIQKIWVPIGTKDFGPYIPQIKSDADAIFTLMVGPMSLQFPKQLRASGNKTPIIGGGTSYDEFILPHMGDEVIGDVSSFMYSAALQTPKNEAFVKKFRSLYGKVPSYYSEANYTTAQWIDATIKKSGSKFPGALPFIKTMRSIKLNAVRGPVSLDDTNTVVENIYIRKVEKKKMFGYPKAELWNTVIKTYHNVSQFWHYNKAKFLKQPVYSRNFPPCKYCE